MNRIKISLLLLVVVLALSACNKGKIKELEEKNIQLSQVNQIQDSLLNDFMSLVNNFEDNIDAIKQREQLISVNADPDDPEFQKDRKDLILEDVAAINELLLRNSEIIDSLSSKLKGSSGKNRELRRAISRYKKTMEEKTQEIASLHTQLKDMNITINSLSTRVDTLTEVADRLAVLAQTQGQKIDEQGNQISDQDEKLRYQKDMLNTAYYIIGSSRDLKANNVLKTSKRLASEFNRSAFTQIDITKLARIPLGTKKANLMTQHPADSYTLVKSADGKTIDYVDIKNVERFWSASKYLVIATN